MRLLLPYKNGSTKIQSIEDDKIFVTTKVHPENLGYHAMKNAVQKSLALPGFEGYLDAVLIHKSRYWEGACTKEPEGTWQESWIALEEFFRQRKVRAIGICDVIIMNKCYKKYYNKRYHHI